jgi:hypothetical protein
MKIVEIENAIKDIFEKEKSLVKSVDTVFEKTPDGKLEKLIISIHDLRWQDTTVIHTKFIFYCNLERTDIVKNMFSYLYDITCVYQDVEFSDVIDLKRKIKDIINSNKFGKDIQLLSELIDTPGVLISSYFRQQGITEYSVGNFRYEPKFKISPCKETHFDFDIDIENSSNTYKFNVCVEKKHDVDKSIFYELRVRLMDKTEVVEVDKLINLHFLIGGKIVDMLNKLLKK